MVPLLVLLGLYLLLQIVCFRLIGRFIVDAGKELTVPWLMLDGQMLYRDIFWLYGPWAPSVNALAYALFGVHTDVLLWVAKLLGAGVVLGVYRCLRLLAPARIAFLGALSIIAFSSTSNYFAWPYSFSNLWATCLALFATDAMVRWWQSGTVKHLLISALLTIIVVWCKFIIGLPILAALWCFLIVARRQPAKAEAAVTTPLISVAIYTALVLVMFAISVWYFSRFTTTESYRLQLGAVFHARHLTAAGLYDRLNETIFLQNGFSAENVSAALAVLICPFSAIFSVFTWWRFWIIKKEAQPSLLLALPFLVFATGNLLQMNSSVHAPYVFPALAVSFFHSLYLWQMDTSWGRKLATALLIITVTFCVTLGMGRVIKALDSSTSVMVSTPRFHFRWSKSHGPAIQYLADKIRTESAPSDRIIVFSGHDFLYLLSDRKPVLGYFYTWYEPFHDAGHSQNVEAALKSQKAAMIVTHVEDNFSLAFAGHGRAHPIYQTLRTHYEPIVDPARQGGFVLWKRKTVPPR
ncbi:MAG TPA: hypothetical protein VGH19_20640 [Verrucomicrobiae bacterium]